jgi:hypothetical protein
MSLRAPTCRGVAISLAKFQIPKSKLQTNPNIKIPSSKLFGHLYFVFDIVWDLVLEIWDFFNFEA